MGHMNCYLLLWYVELLKAAASCGSILIRRFLSFACFSFRSRIFCLIQSRNGLPTTDAPTLMIQPREEKANFQKVAHANA